MYRQGVEGTYRQRTAVDPGLEHVSRRHVCMSLSWVHTYIHTHASGGRAGCQVKHHFCYCKFAGMVGMCDDKVGKVG